MRCDDWFDEILAASDSVALAESTPPDAESEKPLNAGPQPTFDPELLERLQQEVIQSTETEQSSWSAFENPFSQDVFDDLEPE